ncbi:hypothetical protein BDV40DRAFT_311554 [Aspergillus tamarii]|uniref:N-acetylgalactosaminide beta-1,3-galactosyltransferase n=1 Tax=Aspergillus tamarii TaxID=41984 RepID=A0A5N6UB32_ASPTM|nr:hypothetical protein BDV40DRAFT_311554 [Aspergillus tamarii]
MIHSRWRILRVAVGLLLVLLLLKETGYAQRQTKSHTDTTIPNTTGCPELPGIHDAMVVLKTGATEALEKVPVHFSTTLKCIPNFIIFSDFEEKISGIQIHDVLRSVDGNIKQKMTEFHLYNRLHESGRAGLTAEDFNDDPSTPSGKPDNRGWLLDKWKFLPMIDETLHARADARWYVFIEADTYVVWPNLLAWLEKFDPSQPYYMGSGVQIVNSVFGHGGSGLVLSHAAAHKVSAYRASRIKEYDDFTAKQWAGDYVLGKALKDAGIGLFFSNPMLQGDTPWTFPYYDPNKNDHWCTPVITYHHMTPNNIRQMWAFEQSWWLDTLADTLLHADVFKGFVRPQVGQKEDWDNISSDENTEDIRSWEDCQAQCEKDYQCHQFSYEPFKCLTSKVARRGSRKPGISSGWMVERINRTIDRLGSCQKINWIVP